MEHVFPGPSPEGGGGDTPPHSSHLSANCAVVGKSRKRKKRKKEKGKKKKRKEKEKKKEGKKKRVLSELFHPSNHIG